MEQTPTSDAAAKLPQHVRETIDAITELHAEHRRTASGWERAFEKTAAILATPAFLLIFSVAAFAWMAANILITGIDPAPFPFLDTLLALLAVYISLAILAAQRRAGVLADLRAQLTLQHSILAENKAAKIIQLLEELRKDDPMIADRPDQVAADMAAPTDTTMVAAVISEKSEEG